MSPVVRVIASGTFAAGAVAAALMWSGDRRETAARAASPVSGRSVFEAKGCVVCHEVTHVGPDLTGLGARAGTRVDGLDPAAYVRQSILEPQAFIVPDTQTELQMPALPVTAEEVAALVAYLVAR